MSNNFSYGELTTLTLGGVTEGQVLSIEHSGIKAEKVDCTVLGDTVKKFRSATAIDPGELTFTILHTKSLGYEALVENGCEMACVLTFHNATCTSGGASEVVVDTWTWAKAIPISYKVENIKENANVEAQLVVAFNDLPVIS